MDTVKDTFEVLADISLPELQHTQLYSNIADGPFAVEFDGNGLALGAQLTMLPTGIVSFLFGSSMKFITKGIPVSVDSARQTITFGGKEGSHYILRPLTVADQKFFYPDLTFSGLDEFKDFIAQKAMRILGSTDDLTDFAITSENGSVLGMFQHTSDGFFRREKGRWIKLNKDVDSDWDDVDDKLWTPVLGGAVGVYDKSTGSDSISQDIFTPYIVY